MIHLTGTEEIVLWSVWKLRDQAYGVPIRKQIAGITGKSLPYGTLYSALARLEKGGYIRKTIGGSTPERGGRSKNYYSMTGKGIDAMKALLALKRSMWDRETELALSRS